MAWLFSVPAASFDVRGRWEGPADAAAGEGIRPEQFVGPMVQIALSFSQAAAPAGLLPIPLGDVVFPPGELTKGDGEMAEDVPGAWPQFLGPKRNARSRDFTALADSWPAAGPPVVWSVDLGPGHAGAVIYDGRAYVMDYRTDADPIMQGDALRCLSMKDGKEIWSYWYPVSLAEDHGISRSVPAIAADYVITFGPACHVMCTDALTGEYQWWMNLVQRYTTRVPEWYASQCPLIDEDKAIIATGGTRLMIAVSLAPETEGKPEILWEVENPVPGKGADGLQITHSSVMPMTFKGKRVYLYCTTKGIVGVGEVPNDEGEPKGKLLWRYPNWRPGINPVSPVVLDDERFAVCSAEGGLILRMVEDPDKTIRVEQVGEDLRPKALSSYQQTPVLDGNYLYVVLSQKAGALRGQLACLDVSVDPIKTVWLSGRQDVFRWGPYLKTEDRMFLLNDETGELTMARVSPDGYERLARAKLLHNIDAWAPMALAGGRLILRDETRMICVDLRADRTAPAEGKDDGTE